MDRDELQIIGIGEYAVVPLPDDGTRANLRNVFLIKKWEDGKCLKFVL
jgi:hypothetical protein